MRKIVLGSSSPSAAADGEWLDLEQAATVEVTSEASDRPIEAALVESLGGAGWSAESPGVQRIRLRFDAPVHVRRILFEVHDDTSERTQEVAIVAVDARDRIQELVRQQWNFSPRGSTREAEDYRVDLRDTTAIELTIRPDVHHDRALATLSRLRIGVARPEAVEGGAS